MPLFKVWSEDKLNKKFVVAENFAEFVSKAIEAILFIFVHFMSAWHDRIECCMPRVISEIHIRIFKASLSFSDRLNLHILFVG